MYLIIFNSALELRNEKKKWQDYQLSSLNEENEPVRVPASGFKTLA